MEKRKAGREKKVLVTADTSGLNSCSPPSPAPAATDKVLICSLPKVCQIARPTNEERSFQVPIWTEKANES